MQMPRLLLDVAEIALDAEDILDECTDNEISQSSCVCAFSYSQSVFKPCFVYLSFFPEDEEIDYQYLINLWVAEGFVPQEQDRLDIGWSHISHLHSLCLVERVSYQYGEDYRYDQYSRWFRLHDLLFDLAISIATSCK